MKTDFFTDLTVVNIRDDGEWLKIIWSCNFDDGSEFITSSFAYENRKKFLDSLSLKSSDVFSIRDKTLQGRVYENRDNDLLVDPLTVRFKPVEVSNKLFANMAALKPLPVPKIMVPAPVKQESKSLAGLKGGDTKSLKSIVKACSSFLDRDSDRVDNKVREQIANLHISLLKELNNRK